MRPNSINNGIYAVERQRFICVVWGEFGRELSIFVTQQELSYRRILKVEKSYTCLLSNIHLQALPFHFNS